MDIEGLGEKRAQQLIDAGLVQRLSSLYRLTEDDLVSLDRFAKGSAENLLREIENSKEQTLPRFLYALGIPLVGEHLARVLAENFEMLEDLIQASPPELEAIDEIGPAVARSVVTFFAEDRNREVIHAMREADLQLTNPYYKEAQQPLEGSTFVFTGSLERWTRDEVKRHVEQLGGRATSSVSSQTDYVVAGPGAGSKLEAAKEQGVTILDEEQFKAFLREHRPENST
jgi:DNA ligase (NAD+)